MGKGQLGLSGLLGLGPGLTAWQGFELRLGLGIGLVWACVVAISCRSIEFSALTYIHAAGQGQIQVQSQSRLGQHG